MALPENIRKALIAGGINLVFDWYNSDPDMYNPTGFDGELPLIVAAGAKHVRLPISMDIIEDGTTGKVRTDRYADLLKFLTLAKSHGLVVIVDMHNTGMKEPGDADWTDDYMGQLTSPEVRARHLSLLTDLAGRLGKDADLDWTVLAPANEPIFTTGNKAIWYAHQKTLIPAMRAVAPGLVLVSMANDWQGIEATLQEPSLPFADDRVIVDCHFYEPMGITHPKKGKEAAVTYPGVYQTWRGSELWDKSRIEKLFIELAAWRTKHNVFVHFSEIGTKCSVPETVRAAYLSDVVSILRGHVFGYTVYDWRTSKAHNFGIKMHPAVVRAVFTVTAPPVVEPPPPPPPPVDPPPVTPVPLTEAQIRAIVADEVKRVFAEMLKRLFDAAALG